MGDVLLPGQQPPRVFGLPEPAALATAILVIPEPASPHFFITAAITQAAGSTAGALTESFNATVAATQAPAIASATAVEVFNVAVAATQLAASTAAVLTESFTVAVATTQATATTGAELTESFTVDGAVVQPAASVAATVIVTNPPPPPEPPYAPREIITWDPPLKHRLWAEVAVVQRVARAEAFVTVTPVIHLAIAVEQHVARAIAEAALSDSPDEELLILMR